jgi:hypothetical protein
VPKQKSARQVVFVASIPDIKTAIGISGEGDGRLVLDIPQSELAEVVKLTLLSNKALKVTVEELESQVRINAGDTQA